MRSIKDADSSLAEGSSTDFSGCELASKASVKRLSICLRIFFFFFKTPARSFSTLHEITNFSVKNLILFFFADGSLLLRQINIPRAFDKLPTASQQNKLGYLVAIDLQPMGGLVVESGGDGQLAEVQAGPNLAGKLFPRWSMLYLRVSPIA